MLTGADWSPTEAENPKMTHFKTFQDPSLTLAITGIKGPKQVPFNTPFNNSST